MVRHDLRRQHAVPERQRSLDEARRHRRAQGVADVALHRADAHERTARPVLAPEPLDRLDLARLHLADARAVRLDEADRRHRSVRLAERLRQDPRGIVLRIVADRDGPDQRVDPVVRLQRVLAPLENEERAAFARDRTRRVLLEGMQLRARRERHFARKPLQVRPVERRRQRARQGHVRLPAAQVVAGVHHRRRAREKSRVHDFGRPGEGALARDPRDEPIARSEQERRGVRLGQGFLQLRLRLLQQLLRRVRHEAPQDLHRLVEIGRMLQPVHGRGVERGRIAETDRAADRLARVGTDRRVRQRVEGKLRRKVEVLVLARIDLTRKILHRRDAGVEVA